jgi:hypothetical protein
VFATIYAFSTLYQFWIHTELVGKVRGPIEWVLNLPQHHRVHHARNPQYLDKNYGATLIVWDRLFGSFAEETEPCSYGLTKPIASFSPLWAQVHYLVEMAEMMWRAEGLDKVRVVYKGPAFVPRGCPAPKKAPLDVKHHANATRGAKRYVLVQYALLTGGTFVFMMWGATARLPLKYAGAALIVLTTATLAAVLEKKPWARPLEAARVLGLFVFAGAAYVHVV